MLAHFHHFLFPSSFFLGLSRSHTYGCRSLCTTLQGRSHRVERHVAGVGESGGEGTRVWVGVMPTGGQVRKPRLARAL